MSEIVFPYEVQQTAELYDQQRDVGYAEITSKSVTVPAPSIQELKDFYQNNLTKYQTEELFDVQRIYVDFNKIVASINVSEERAKDYYYNNLIDFTEHEQWNISYISIEAPEGSDLAASGEAETAISDIHAKLKLGQDFGAVSQSAIKEHNADVGRLGWVNKNPQLPNEIFLLNKPGAVSEVLKLDQGYFVFKLEDKKEYKQKSYEEVKNIVQSRIVTEEAEEIVYSKMEQLEDSFAAHNNPDLRQLAKDLELEFDETKQAKAEDLLGAFKDKDIVKITKFINELKVKPQQASKFIELDRRNGVGIQIVKHYPGAPIDFMVAQVDVLNDYNKEMAALMVKAKTHSLWEDINNGVSPNAACKKHHVQWKTLRALPRQSLIKDNDLVKQLAFSLPNPRHNLTNLNVSAYRIKDENVGVVVAVSDAYPNELSQTVVAEDGNNKFKHELLNTQVKLYIGLVLENLRTQSKIKNY